MNEDEFIKYSEALERISAQYVPQSDEAMALFEAAHALAFVWMQKRTLSAYRAYRDRLNSPPADEEMRARLRSLGIDIEGGDEDQELE